jgi:hypothetical protein
MDTFGAFALPTELMTRAPVGLCSSLITNVMWRNIFGMALYQVAVLLVLQFMGTMLPGLGTESEHDQLVLKMVISGSLVLCQVRWRDVCTVLPESSELCVLRFRGAKQVGARSAGVADGRTPLSG